jgi:hypothetical protein
MKIHFRGLILQEKERRGALTISRLKRSKGRISTVNQEEHVALDLSFRVRSTSRGKGGGTFRSPERQSPKRITFVGCWRDDNCRSCWVSSSFGVRAKRSLLLQKRPKPEVRSAFWVKP